MSIARKFDGIFDKCNANSASDEFASNVITVERNIELLRLERVQETGKGKGTPRARLLNQQRETEKVRERE